MKAIDSKSYLGYLNKLVDEYNNSYHCSISKKSTDADYSGLTATIESSRKALKFKVGDKVRITKYKNFFIRGYTKNWSREIFVIDFVLKSSSWTYKIKDLNKEKITGSFYEKELLLSNL